MILIPDCIQLAILVYTGLPSVCETCVQVLALFIDLSQLLAKRYTQVQLDLLEITYSCVY